MQITAELDNQHIEKLQALEKLLKKNTSELIAFAIDEIYNTYNKDNTMNLFTDQELQTLSAEIDKQLSELANDPASNGITKRTGHTPKTIPSKQKQQLEQVIEQDLGTKETADSFMKKFARTAKQDLCVEGGVLYGQWKKYGDLENESMLKNFGGVLAGLGFTSAPLQTAVVAVSVIVIHIGIKAFCEDCQ